MREKIAAFCEAFAYPKEAEETLLAAYDAISCLPEAAALLQENERLLWEDGFTELGEELVRLDRIAALTGVHRFTVHQIYFICCSFHTWELYQQRGLSGQIFLDSMRDIKCKMMKTHRLFGIWGTNWGIWFRDFFLLKRFGLGRLEFELIPSVVTYEDHGCPVKLGDPVVNIHVPAAGPLYRQAVLDSYEQAARFYADQFPDGVIPFQCESWLLYPRVAALFPAGNLRSFYEDFQIVTAGIMPDVDDRWRIFMVPETVPVADYPEDTTLQRNLKQWLLAGNTMGIGVGMFYYRDGRILPPEVPQPELHELETLVLSAPNYTAQ